MLEWLEKEWIGKGEWNVVKAAGVRALSYHKLEQSDLLQLHLYGSSKFLGEAGFKR